MAYIDVAKIENIRFMCHKVLPLVYDESLSYYETLCKVANKINETIDATNQLEDNVSALNNTVNTININVQHIADEINSFESEITDRFNTLETEINANVDAKLGEVDAKMAEYDTRIDGALAEMEAKERELTDYVNAQVAEMTRIVNTAITEAIADMERRFDLFTAEMQEYVKATLQAYLDQIPEITSVIVVDPTTGELTPIQDVINHIYWDVNPNSLNCYELDHLGFTCGELDNFLVYSIPRGLTVWEWSNKARQLLWTEHKLKMRDFVTGKHCLYKKNVALNNALLKASGSYTAGEFDSLAITASEFDALAITAYNYDWHSNTMVVTE